MQYVLTMQMVRDQYTQKKDQEKFKNIVPKTPFFKDFPSTKKFKNNSRNSSTAGHHDHTLAWVFSYKFAAYFQNIFL